MSVDDARGGTGMIQGHRRAAHLRTNLLLIVVAAVIAAVIAAVAVVEATGSGGASATTLDEGGGSAVSGAVSSPDEGPSSAATVDERVMVACLPTQFRAPPAGFEVPPEMHVASELGDMATVTYLPDGREAADYCGAQLPASEGELQVCEGPGVLGVTSTRASCADVTEVLRTLPAP